MLLNGAADGIRHCLGFTSHDLDTVFQDTSTSDTDHPSGMQPEFRLAERVGFEPTRSLHPCWFSRPVQSTALPPLLLEVKLYRKQTLQDGFSGMVSFQTSQYRPSPRAASMKS